MDQPSFGSPAVEVLLLQAQWRWPEGWSLRITARRSGATGLQSWSSDAYGALSADELAQVVGDALVALLGL